MVSIRKCAKCGLDLTDTQAKICPMCGTPLLSPRGMGIWIGALIQIAASTTFMILFGFPKIMILVFSGMILLGTVVSTRLKVRPVAARPAPQQTLSNPALFRVLSFAIFICFLGFVCSLLFGFVIFMNSWNMWHRYEGQPYHRSDFQVDQTYYQRNLHSGDAYASGKVEGGREWMDLEPYLHMVPRNQADLDARISPGTIIPIYFFPNLKGRSRVRVYAGLPPAEANHRAAINAVNYGLLGVALSSGAMFVLVRLRKLCVAQSGTISS